LKIKLLNPSFPKPRDEISFKADSLSHPKIFILECEPFFQKKLKIFKGLHLFEFKMILFDFILYLNESNESKYLSGVQIFLKTIIHLSFEKNQ
jgi:hypothetical protein